MVETAPATAAAPTVTLESVTVAYGRQAALRDVSAAFPSGAVGLLRNFVGGSFVDGGGTVLLTTKASESAYASSYRDDDILMVGRESAGVPAEIAADADLRIRIPMLPERRSLNVAVAASLILGEALRQTGRFETLT